MTSFVSVYRKCEINLATIFNPPEFDITALEAAIEISLNIIRNADPKCSLKSAFVLFLISQLSMRRETSLSMLVIFFSKCNQRAISHLTIKNSRNLSNPKPLIDNRKDMDYCKTCIFIYLLMKMY